MISVKIGFGSGQSEIPSGLGFLRQSESVLTTSMSRQRGFAKSSVFLKRVSLLNPGVRTKFVAFPFRKNQERASKFGSTLGRDRGLVNNCSAAAGRAPKWTGRTLNPTKGTKIVTLAARQQTFVNVCCGFVL